MTCPRSHAQGNDFLTRQHSAKLLLQGTRPLTMLSANLLTMLNFTQALQCS